MKTYALAYAAITLTLISPVAPTVAYAQVSKPVRISCNPVPDADGTTIRCTMISRRSGLFKFVYRFYSERFKPDEEAWLSVTTFIGEQSQLPNLPQCPPLDKRPIDNATRIEARCEKQMKAGRRYAFKAIVRSQNSKNGRNEGLSTE